MAPSRDHGRGTAILDRRFRGVGRIKKASGTNDADTYRLLNGMLDTLFAGGRLDLLDAVRDGVVTPLELWDKFRVGELHRLPTAESMRALWKRDAQGQEVGALETWRAGYDCGDHHRANLKRDFAQLRKVAKAGATVGDLPAVLRAYRARCAKAGHRVAFNRARAAVLAFCRSELGRAHRLWAACAEVEGFAVKAHEPSPCTPAEARAIAERLGPTHGPTWWAMCVTGMGPGELWGRWSIKPDRIFIGGTKREGRRRDVPLVERIAVPQTKYRAFRDKLTAVTEGARTPYDARHSYGTWLEAAHIPRTRRKLYLGHGIKDVTDLYERHEITAFLTEDAARLRTLLGTGPGTDGGLRLVSGDAE